MNATTNPTLRGLILDMDGVIWRDTQPIGDLPDIFARINRLGLRVVLATNNATLTVSQYLAKLKGFGVSLERWQIVNSPHAAGRYLQKMFPTGGGVYIIGEAGLTEILAEYDFTPGESAPCAVVVGMDRGVTYEKLLRASQWIRAGALFVGTNPDRTFPIPGGVAPGAGALLAAIEAATDRAPIIVGKPSAEMYHLAMERLGTTPTETLVVGDRLETDIAGAQVLGCATGLVLSGVTSLEQAAALLPKPDRIEADLAALITHLENGLP